MLTSALSYVGGLRVWAQTVGAGPLPANERWPAILTGCSPYAGGHAPTKTLTHWSRGDKNVGCGRPLGTYIVYLTCYVHTTCTIVYCESVATLSCKQVNADLTLCTGHMGTYNYASVACNRGGLDCYPGSSFLHSRHEAAQAVKFEKPHACHKVSATR